MWIAMNVFSGCSRIAMGGCLEGCVDSHGCVLRVFGGVCVYPWVCSQGVWRGVWIAMDVLSGCLEGCVYSHGCVLRVFGGVCV